MLIIVEFAVCSHPAGCLRPVSLLPHRLTLPQEQHLACSLHRGKPAKRRESKNQRKKTDSKTLGKQICSLKWDFTLALLGSPGPRPLLSRGTAPCSLAPLNRSSTTSLELFFLGGPTICCPLRSEPPAKNLTVCKLGLGGEVLVQQH